MLRTMKTERYTPIFVTFRELTAVLAPLHLGVQADLDRLHDIWKQGAPSPDSVIRTPARYDPRVGQAGNVEKRLMLYTQLAQWIVDVSARRGFPYTLKQTVNLLHGRADYGVDSAS